MHGARIKIKKKKKKKADNVTCLNWKFPVVSDLKINNCTEEYVVAAV